METTDNENIDVVNAGQGDNDDVSRALSEFNEQVILQVESITERSLQLHNLVASIRQNVVVIDSWLGEFFSAYGNDVAIINNAMTQFKEAIDTATESFNTAISNLDEAITTYNTQIKELNALVQEKKNGVDEKIQGVNTKLTGLGTVVADAKQQLTTLGDNTKGKLDTLDTSIAEFNTFINENIGRVKDSLSSQIESLTIQNEDQLSSHNISYELPIKLDPDSVSGLEG